jgi:hypothetical protein
MVYFFGNLTILIFTSSKIKHIRTLSIKRPVLFPTFPLVNTVSAGNKQHTQNKKVQRDSRVEKKLRHFEAKNICMVNGMPL